VSLHPERRRRPPFLIVEHDPKVARELTVFLGRHAPTVLASSVKEARYALGDHPRWSGVVTEMRLPDGSGIEFLEDMQAHDKSLVGLVLTNLRDPSVFELASADRTIFATRPPNPKSLAAFVVSCLALDQPETRRPSAPPGVPSVPPPTEPDPPTDPELKPEDVPFMARAAAVKDEAYNSGLTTREMQVLGLAVEGRDRKQTIGALGLDGNSYEAHLRRIVAKTRSKDLAQLVQRVLAAAQGRDDDD
jgi:DNA-binding NarL/FixJ family response regulator